MQLSQLRSVHANWFTASVAPHTADPRATNKFIRCADPSTVHVIWDSQLQFKAADVVSREALALGAHNATVSAPAVFLPPANGVGVQVVAAAPGQVDARQGALLPPMLADQAIYRA